MEKNSRKFKTYSGADIVVTATPNIEAFDKAALVLGELMAISYSVNRQKFPVRILGSAPILAYTKGPRTVAGTMVFSVFDEHALRELMTFDDIRRSEIGLVPGLERAAQEGSGREVGSVRDGEAITGERNLGNQELDRINQAMRIHTVDDIPPLDVTITYANEYGSASVLKIIGVEFVDDGAVMSIQDLVTQNTISYVARDIVLLSATSTKEGEIFDLPLAASFRQ